jgi:light-regulated signal transduction histidine kinase (bacteriophytochrome)
MESWNPSVTPCLTIDGFSQALIEDCSDRLDPAGQDYLNRIRNATQRMGHLIDDLLNLSQVTRSEMHPEDVNLSNIANSISMELQRDEPERQVEFQTQPGLKTHGDAPLLQILLTNLLTNAWKFTSKRSQGHIEFGMMAPAGDITTYFVRDNGAGFDMAFAGKLFGPFQRLHRTTEFPGNGIGLATVQRIVHRHGGKVWAEGALDQGATFYFTLQPEVIGT